MLRVVLIEDNAADVYLLQEALRSAARCEFTVLGDGDSAYRYFVDLEGEGPDLVVLDLNLPGKDGEEVLALIRESGKLEGIPVAIVSSSPKDVVQKKVGKADGYVTKPSDLDEYMAIGRELVACARRRVDS